MAGSLAWVATASHEGLKPLPRDGDESEVDHQIWCGSPQEEARNKIPQQCGAQASYEKMKVGKQTENATRLRLDATGRTNDKMK
jgi:hypothetical protein